MKIHAANLVAIMIALYLLTACTKSTDTSPPSSSSLPSSNSSNPIPSTSIKPPDVTLEVPVIPLDISLDLNGKITFTPRAKLKIPTPLGTIKFSPGGLVLKEEDMKGMQDKYDSKRILVIVIDDKASVYELEKGKKFKVSLEFDNKLFKKVEVKNDLGKTDEMIVVQLTTVPDKATSPTNLETSGNCLQGEKNFVTAETENFLLTICGRQKPEYYVGDAKNGNGRIRLPITSITKGKYVIKNRTTSYTLDPHNLTVAEDNKVIKSEKIISYKQ